MLLDDHLDTDADRREGKAGATGVGSLDDDGVRDEAPSELFDRHVALAERRARRYSFGRGIDDDLRQVALLGLHLATQRFDPDLGHFAPFASVTIDGELKKHLRNTGWRVRVPRSRQEDAITVNAADERLTARLARTPTVGEIAQHTGFDHDRVVEARRARRARFAEALDDVDAPPASATSLEDAAIMSVTLDQLEHTQRRLIRLRYTEGLDRTTIARRVGMSCTQVDRRLKRALSVLRRQLEE